MLSARHHKHDRYLQVRLCVLQDVADARVSLTGYAKAMPEQREDAVRNMYKSKNTESFWADFGDFKPFYMEEIVAVHFNGGFGRAGRKVSSHCRWQIASVHV